MSATHELLLTALQLGLALFSGAIIGIERQINNANAKKRIGMRDFSLIGLLAFVSSYYQKLNPESFAWGLAFGGIILFSVIFFTFESIQKQKEDGLAGMTTVIALPTSFLISSLAVFHIEFWLLATLVFTSLVILEIKDQWDTFSKTIEKQEVVDFSILIAIAVILTPLIPAKAQLMLPLYNIEKGMLIWTGISIAKFWKVLLMVSFMSFLSHFITKYIKGRNALLLATFTGGLVSSLATIILFLKNDQKEENYQNLFLGYMAAGTGSVLKDVVILTSLVPMSFLSKLFLPLASIFLMMFSITLFTFSRTQTQEEIRITKRPLPFDFIINFSIVFSIVIICMTVVMFYLGRGGLIIGAFVSGLVSSAAALASITEGFPANGTNEVVLAIGIILTLVGSITAKYTFIAKRIGFQKSLRFLFPVVYMCIIGAVTLMISFGM